MNNTLSSLFEPRPERWGLRGDPYLWEDLQQSFSEITFPCSETKVIRLFEHFFEELTGHSFNTDCSYYVVDKYKHGGMSSGGISIEFWKEAGLPLLLSRLRKQTIN